MVAAHSRWRAVAETSDLASVVGPRVRFLCLDADETHVVLGANTGSLYVFARRRASADATEDASSDAAARDADSGRDSSSDDPERDDAEGALRFLTMVSPADAPPIEPREDPNPEPETGARPDRGAARRNVTVTPALARVKLHPGGSMCAVANAAGVVQVLAFAFSTPAQADSVHQRVVSARSSPGRVVVQVPHGHAGKRVTWLEWSADGRRLASGDDGGALCVTDITLPSDARSSHDDSPSFAATNQTPPRCMTPTELLTTAASTSVYETGSPIAQASFDAAGDALAVSTADAAFVLAVASGVRPRLGAKPRLGPFGACFHARAAEAVSLELAGSGSGSGLGSDRKKGAGEWLIAARPGRRLWVAETWLDEDGRTPVTRVAATLRPAVPPPSNAPGAIETRDKPTRQTKPRKFEFGVVRKLGDVCALVECDRALAVLDVPGGAMLDLFPIGDPAARDIAFGARDVATSGAKAFVLAERPEASASAVWCLEAPASPEALARAVADAASLDGGADAFARALATATRMRVVEMGLLEDARGELRALSSATAAAAASSREKPADASSEEAFEEALCELKSALDAYEAFIDTVPADARPPPRRKKPRACVLPETSAAVLERAKKSFENRAVPGGEEAREGSVPAPDFFSVPARASEPPSSSAVVARAALVATAAAPAKAPSSAAGPSPSATAEAYPPAAASTKFFFYNPHSGFVRNAPDGGDETFPDERKGAPPPDAEAEAPFRRAQRLAGTAERRRAKIVDDIANAPEESSTEWASRERFSLSPDGDDFESAFESARSAETASFAARLEEDRTDALAALAALELTAEAEAEGDSGADDVPFLHWSAYDTEARETASFEDVLFPSLETTHRSSSVSSMTRTMTEVRDEREEKAFGVSPAERKRASRRRARRRRVDAAAAARAALAVARRSLDAGGLAPLLRRWRAARDDDDAVSHGQEKPDDSFEGLEGLEESFVSTDIETLESGSASKTLVDAAARAVADADAALARAEARLEAAEEELGLRGAAAADRDPDADRDPFAAAAAALAARDARFAEAERLSPGSPPVLASSASRDSDDAKPPALRGNDRNPALGGSSEVSVRAMRRALRDVVSAAEEASRARAFAADAPSHEKDGAALARRAEARGAASRAALRDAASETPSDSTELTSAGRITASQEEASDPLACLRAAIEGDEKLAALASEPVASPGGAALAECVAEVSLRLSDARVARAARARAAARTLAPLEAHLASPPPRALGRFPQLRALLKAERALARDPEDDAALRALPFVRESVSGDEKGTKTETKPSTSRWRVAGANGVFDADIAPFLEERGDWGARVAFKTARCPRCALPLRLNDDDAEERKGSIREKPLTDLGDEDEDDAARKKTFVAFPCGHAFHKRCVPEEACVECLRLRGERLSSPAPGAHREGVAANAALKALFPS
jgi:hypothetical protein